jgi:two-component system chemotaxis sensor kinase CheA
VLRISAISRLEEFPTTAIEHAGDREVLQYRDRILPLLRVSDLLRERRRAPRHPDVVDTAAERSRVQIAVLARGEGSVGLVIDRILDVVDLPPDIQSPGSRAGVRGTIVVDGRVAEVLDVDQLLRMAEGA